MTGYVADLSWKSGARDRKVRSTKVDAGDFKHELLNRLRSTMAVNVLILEIFSKNTSLFWHWNFTCKISKFRPRTGREGPEREQSYSSTLSLTSELEDGDWSKSCPGLITPGKRHVHLWCKRLCGPQGRSGLVRKISPPLRLDSRIVLPVSSIYTDSANSAHVFCMYLICIALNLMMILKLELRNV